MFVCFTFVSSVINFIYLKQLVLARNHFAERHLDEGHKRELSTNAPSLRRPNVCRSNVFRSNDKEPIRFVSTIWIWADLSRCFECESVNLKRRKTFISAEFKPRIPGLRVGGSTPVLARPI
jgi:hypothetical protein